MDATTSPVLKSRANADTSKTSMLKQKLAHFITDHDLLRLPPSNLVSDAAVRMAERHLGAVLITDDEEVLGIFTERDMLEKVIASGRTPGGTTLAEVMTPNPAFVTPSDTVLDAILAMKEHRSRHLLVREDVGIVGIVSVRDILRAVIVERTEDRQHLEDLWEGFPV